MQDWGNGIKKLDKATLEMTLKEIEGIERLGRIYSAEEIGYPVTIIDVVDTVKYVLEKDVLGSFANFLNNSKYQKLMLQKALYEIPVTDKTQFGRSTPRMWLDLVEGGDNHPIFGRLYNSYEGQQEILTFIAPKVI